MQTAAYQVIEILNLMTDYLKKNGIENARLNAELLMGHVLKLDRVQLYLNFEKPLQPVEVEELRALLKRRAKKEPLQYILGETEFFSLKFKVNQHTLIPRPETEILVNSVLEICKKDLFSKEKINILDIGTGSGNIAIALAKNSKKIFVTAIDINENALKVARENASMNDVSEQITFLKQNIFENIPNEFTRFDIIVSNPPYITNEAFESLPDEIKQFEPKIALTDESDGLKFYQKILDLLPGILKKSGKAAFELSGVHPEKIVKLFTEKNYNFELIKDLNKIDRVVLINI